MNTIPSTQMEHTSRLLFHPQPHDFETLAGYLLRITDLNCLQHPQELLEFLEERAESLYQPPLTPQLGVYSLRNLAQHLKQPIEKITTMSWPLDVRVGKYRRFTYQGLTWPLDLLRHDYRAWCPYCLSEASLQRADWDWHLSTCCHKHQVVLLDKCPACFNRVSWRYASLHRCSCGFPLHTAQATPATTDSPTIDICTLTATEIQRYIILALLLIENPTGGVTARDFSEITIMELNKKISAISLENLQHPESFQEAIHVCLENRYRDQPELGPRYATAPLTLGLNIDKLFDQDMTNIANCWLNKNNRNAERHLQSTAFQPPKNLTIDVAAHMLNVSRHVLCRLIKQKVLEAVSESGSLVKLGRTPRKAPLVGGCSLKRLQCFLSKCNSVAQGHRICFDHFGADFSTRLDLLSDLLEGKAEVLSYNPCIGLPSLELMIPIKQAMNSKFLSARETAKILNIYPDAVYRLVKSGLLRYSLHLIRQIRIDIDDLGKFHQEFVFVRELADQVKCNATNLADKIISAGIKPVHGPSIDGGLLYVFRRKEVETLDLVAVSQSRYQSRCGRGHKSQPLSKEPNLLSASDACKFLDIKPRQLDRLCHLGFLAPRRISNGGQLYLDKTELEEYLASYRNNKMLTRLEDVKLKMGMKTIFWNDLVNLGLIRPVSDGIIQYCQKDQLTQAIKFRSTLFSTKQLSAASGLCKATIRWEARYGCLADMAIRSSNGYLKLFFPKSALTKLRKLRNLLNKRTGRS